MAADYNDVRAESRTALRRRFASGRVLLLDGATGTELERRGARSTLPLWSSWGLLEAPELVRAIHLDYLRAGVDLVTAATFRTHARSLAAAGLESRSAELSALAVRLAREAGEQVGRAPLVLGSAAPLEDCYHPERVPEEAVLAREHAQHARNLVLAGVDGILVETINRVREAVAAARAAREAGAEVLVSFVCDTHTRLLSGEPLAEALDAVAPFTPLAVGVNCLSLAAAAACLDILRGAGRPFLVYANVAAPGIAEPAQPMTPDPETFATQALCWIAAGAVCVGGCCGTGPAHLRELVERLARRAALPVSE